MMVCMFFALQAASIVTEGSACTAIDGVDSLFYDSGIYT